MQYFKLNSKNGLTKSGVHSKILVHQRSTMQNAVPDIETNEGEKMAKVQVIERTLEILEVLALEPEGLGVTEISTRVALHKSTVHRILSTLHEWGYVEKGTEADKYKLGMKIIDICSIHLNKIELKTEAYPLLRILTEKSKQPVHLARLEDGQVIYIDKVDVNNSIRMYSQIGRRVPVHCTALGKVLVAGLLDEDVQRIVEEKGLARVTQRTITDRELFMKEVRNVRAREYAIDDEENEEGIRCIAAPIRDYSGKVVAALSTSGASDLFTYNRIESLKEDVMDTGRKISVRMGYTTHLQEA